MLKLELQLCVVLISVLLNEITDLFTKFHQIANCIQTKNSVYYSNCSCCTPHVKIIKRQLANLILVPTRLFKSFEVGNGSRISDEKLVLLEFKYLQNKKW